MDGSRVRVSQGRVRAAVRGRVRALRTRNFHLFFIGQLISNSGNWLTMVAPPAQGHPDRRDGPVACPGRPSPSCTTRLWPRSDVTALAGGCLLAFDNPVRRSFVTEMVPPEDVGNAVTLYSALVNSSRIFGPTVAGALVITAGFGWCFALDAATYLAVLAALWMMRTSELRVVEVTPRGKGQVRAGLRYVRSVPDLWLPFVMLAVVGTMSYNFTVVFPLFVERTLHGNDASYTLVYAVFSVGALLGAFAVADRRTVGIHDVVVAAAGFGVTMLVMAGAPSVAITLPIVAVLGFTSIAFMTATTAIVQVRADPRMHGRVLALQTVLLVGTTPIGGPIMGALADAAGARIPLAVGGISGLGAALFGLLAGRAKPAAGEPPQPAPLDRDPSEVALG